jgi:hypothetical protein
MDGQKNGAIVKDLDRYEKVPRKENEDCFVMQWIRLYCSVPDPAVLCAVLQPQDCSLSVYILT